MAVGDLIRQNLETISNATRNEIPFEASITVWWVFPKVRPHGDQPKFQGPFLHLLLRCICPMAHMQATQKHFYGRKETLFYNCLQQRMILENQVATSFPFWKFSLNQPRLSPCTGMSNSIMPGIASILLCCKFFSKKLFCHYASPIKRSKLSVFILFKWLCQFEDLLFSDVAPYDRRISSRLATWTFLQTLNRFNVLRRLQETFVSACIQPSKTTSHQLNRGSRDPSKPC